MRQVDEKEPRVDNDPHYFRDEAVTSEELSGSRYQHLGPLFEAGSDEGKSHLHWKRKLALKLYPFALLLSDAILITMLFAAVLMLRYDMSLLEVLSRKVLVTIAVPSMIGVYLVGGYNYRVDKRSVRFVSEHLIVSACVAVAVFVALYAFVAYGYKMKSSRFIVAATLLLFPLFSVAYRLILTRYQLRYDKEHILCLIGAGDEARDIYQRMGRSGNGRRLMVTSVDGDRIGQHLVEGDVNSPLVESLESVELGSSINGSYVDGYVLTVDAETLPRKFSQQMVAAQFRRQRIFTYESFFSEELQMVPPSQLSMSWPMSEGFLLNRSVSYDRFKRLVDISAAVFGLVLLLPVLLLTALAVRLTSAGPVIFCQQRTGIREKAFTIYKFRSMRVGAEKGAKYTADGDARLTPIGSFIRKTRLDELPQLWNVLKGDLSLIGPRAEWVELVEGYEQRFPYYHFRHAVKPGITGWAQVNYPYGQNDHDTLEKLNYDLYYVRHYSFHLDVAIVVKTIYMMLFGRGQ